MNKYVKEFFHRGLIFSGFGPIVLGIVYAILSCTSAEVTITGGQALVAIVSIYLVAFVQAGASVFNQIEHWSLPKSLLCHFGSLYLVYVICYLVNTWIPFNINVIIIFTAIFVVCYFLIWIIVYLSIKAVSKKINNQLQ
ncbi:MAG: DUF3021 domain-containing protein [Clostridia bacterium]|nr:DUF3021 domain-containing protein [Clostridia bacterium]